MSNFSGIGTTFSRWSGSAWVAIAGVKDFSGPSSTRETYDTTDFDSNAGYREFIGGLRDSGEVTFTFNFDKTGYTSLKSDFESDDPVWYQLTLPDSIATTLEFQGLVTGIPLNVPLDDVVTIDVTIKVSGEVDVDPSSGQNP
jgi:predicted secreted protein